MFSVGIIGLGHVAVHQMAAIHRSEDFRLVAGCDPDESRRSLLHKSVGAFANAEDMLEHTNPDVIVIASPNRLHVDHGIQAMADGKWVFMEKPLAETAEDFERFAQEKRTTGGRCTLALHAAFGVELEWYCCHRDGDATNGLEIDSFMAEFDDPYVVDGQALPEAASRGGSWMDSGINALSVIGRMIDIESFAVSNSRMTRGGNVECLELEAKVELEFALPRGSGRGEINTSWVAGRDKKITALSFSDSEKTLLLDHSEQQAILRERGREQLLFSCDNDLPRLTNHYIGAFRDLAAQMNSGNDNFNYCRSLHRLVFEAECWDTNR